MQRLRMRIWVEAICAVLAGALGALTIFWHDWIEGLTGWDPDHHNGSFEWLIVLSLFALSALAGLLARHDWRRLRLQIETSPPYLAP